MAMFILKFSKENFFGKVFMKITNNLIITAAKKFQFDLIGFAKVQNLDDEINKLMLWLNSGYQAGMTYMERNVEKRKNVSEVFTSAKTVISLGMNYNSPGVYSNKKYRGKISRYAWGKDYHLVMSRKLKKLIKTLKDYDSCFEAISYVDTGPVMDKAWAVRSGIGWMGKHTNVINQKIGSWFFIANIFTNYEFETSEPVSDYCGTCTACIDACPTEAIVKEYMVDSNKCISYLTIENKNEIPVQFTGRFENWIFGCDICQEVCPWNKKFSINTDVEDFYPRTGITELDLKETINLDQKSFSERFSKSPIKRAKLSGLRRNAEFLMRD